MQYPFDSQSHLGKCKSWALFLFLTVTSRTGHLLQVFAQNVVSLLYYTLTWLHKLFSGSVAWGLLRHTYSVFRSIFFFRHEVSVPVKITSIRIAQLVEQVLALLLSRPQLKTVKQGSHACSLAYSHEQSTEPSKLCQRPCLPFCTILRQLSFLPSHMLPIWQCALRIWSYSPKFNSTLKPLP